MTNRIELRIAERVPFAENHAFGDVGAYERLSGRAHFAVDPRAAAQQDVVDLDKAPRDDSGLVHFAADFMILQPRELQHGRTAEAEADPAESRPDSGSKRRRTGRQFACFSD